MFEQFLIFINSQGWHLERKRVLITVSGGIDSVALVALFQQAGLDYGIAHCNFQLRGEDSVCDEIFVKELANRNEVPFHVIRFETNKVSEELGVSTQMAARSLRYDWFHELAEEFLYDYIVTAHHANDLVETVLLNMTRGTGIAGLKGIPKENGQIIRPLLFATRTQIENYINQNGLEWREDISNSSVYYKRNKLRHQVIPVLKEINPSVEKSVVLMTTKLAAAEKILKESLSNWEKEVVTKEVGIFRISIPALLISSEPVYRLSFLLDKFGFSYEQCVDIFNSLEHISGKKFYSSSHYLLKDRGGLLITTLNLQKSELPELKWELLEYTTDFTFSRNPLEAVFDQDKLKHPVTVRSWKQGDWFCPFGLGGKKKKISDLLIDMKINLLDKQAVKVLVDSEDQILWVIGLRSDERFKVSKSTKLLLRVTYKQEEHQ